jgi:hypothetical protein
MKRNSVVVLRKSAWVPTEAADGKNRQAISR